MLVFILKWGNENAIFKLGLKRMLKNLLFTTHWSFIISVGAYFKNSQRCLIIHTDNFKSRQCFSYGFVTSCGLTERYVGTKVSEKRNVSMLRAVCFSETWVINLHIHTRLQPRRTASTSLPPSEHHISHIYLTLRHWCNFLLCNFNPKYSETVRLFWNSNNINSIRWDVTCLTILKCQYHLLRWGYYHELWLNCLRIWQESAGIHFNIRIYIYIYI